MYSGCDIDCRLENSRVDRSILSTSSQGQSLVSESEGAIKTTRRKFFFSPPTFLFRPPLWGGQTKTWGGHQLGNNVINAQFGKNNFTVYSSNKLPSENIFLCRVKLLMLHFISYLISSVFSLQFIVYCLLYIYFWLTLTYFIIILHWPIIWYNS